jgi:alkanesulfonate monooxygenase SsuD/methylene tetrahydromethanopterin reductase-like flavin-dependent oxidoreductase (luciferase family)
MGVDYHYANQFLPLELSRTEMVDILSRTTRKHLEKNFVIGTPEQVADHVVEYVEAGSTWVQLGDMLAWTLDYDDIMRSPDRTIEFARRVRVKLAQKASQHI